MTLEIEQFLHSERLPHLPEHRGDVNRLVGWRLQPRLAARERQQPRDQAIHLRGDLPRLLERERRLGHIAGRSERHVDDGAQLGHWRAKFV